jgi:hypothetical protein
MHHYLNDVRLETNGGRPSAPTVSAYLQVLLGAIPLVWHSTHETTVYQKSEHAVGPVLQGIPIELMFACGCRLQVTLFGIGCFPAQ